MNRHVVTVAVAATLLFALLLPNVAHAVGVYAPLTITPQANDAIAPHLYDWYFSGTGVVRVPSLTNPGNGPFSVCAWVYNLVKYGRIVASDDNNLNGDWALSYEDGGPNDIRFYYRGASQVILDTGPVLFPNGRYQLVCGVRNPDVGTRYIYLNTAVVAQITSNDTYVTSNTEIVTIGGESPTSPEYPSVNLIGSISSAIIFKAAISSGNISNIYNYIVVPINLTLFLDATFYNGSQYIDISGNGYNGVPYNVARVPVTVDGGKAWIWDVRGLYSDGNVHLRFFPQSSWLVLSNGSLIPMSKWMSTYCPSATVDSAGMVEDCPTPLSAAQGIAGLVFDYSQATRFVSAGGNWYQIVSSFYLNATPPSQYFYVPQGYALVVAEPNGTVYYAGSQAPAIQGNAYFIVYPQPLSLSYLSSASPGCQPGQIMLGYAGFYEADLAVCTSYTSPTSSFSIYASWVNATLLRIEVAYFNYTTSARVPVSIFASAYCYGEYGQPVATGAGTDVVYLNVPSCANGTLVEVSANTTIDPYYDIYVPPAPSPLISPSAAISIGGFTAVAFLATAGMLIGLVAAFISEYGGRNSALAIGILAAALVYIGGPAFGLPQAISQTAAALITIVSVIAWAYARR